MRRLTEPAAPQLRTAARKLIPLPATQADVDQTHAAVVTERRADRARRRASGLRSQRPTGSSSAGSEAAPADAGGTRRALGASRTTLAQRSGRSVPERHAGTEKTGQQHRKYVERFLAWATRRALLLAEAAEIDAAMVGYFIDQWMVGVRASLGMKTLAALGAEMPEFSRLGLTRRCRSHRALRGWRRPTLGHGRRALRLRQKRQMAIYVMLALISYLRPAEGLSLRRISLVPPASGVTRHWSAIICAETGKLTRLGVSDASVILGSEWCLSLRPAFESLTAGGRKAPLWGFVYTDLLKELRLIGQRLGLPELLPYQLQRSEASIERTIGARKQAEIMKRRRWQTMASLARYERALRLAHTLLALPPHVQACAAACEARLADIALQDAVVGVPGAEAL